MNYRGNSLVSDSFVKKLKKLKIKKIIGVRIEIWLKKIEIPK